MIDNTGIEKIRNLVIEEIEKLDPEVKEKYHVSSWLIKTVIHKYYEYRYQPIRPTDAQSD